MPLELKLKPYAEKELRMPNSAEAVVHRFSFSPRAAWNLGPSCLKALNPKLVA